MNANQISHYRLNSPAPIKATARVASLEIEKTLFVMISLMDLLLTTLLLQTGQFFESNPFADFFIDGWGLLGMTGFKMVLVGLILLVINLIAIWRAGVARNVLIFGSLFTGGVVVYSLGLLLSYHGIL